MVDLPAAAALGGTARSTGARGRLLPVAATLLALAGVGLVLRDLDVAALVAALGGADGPSLLAAFLVVQGANLAKALRWRAIAGRGGAGLFTGLIYAGQALNNLWPVRAGDLLRVEMLARRTEIDRATVLGGLAAEKLLDLCLLGLSALLLLSIVPVPAGLEAGRIGLVAAGAAAGLALLGLGPRLLARVRLWPVAGRLLARLVDGAAILRRPRALAAAVGWTAVAWAAGGLGNYWVLVGLGVDGALMPAAVLLVALYAGMPVPSLPGRLGLHQAICLAALAPFALGDAVALAAALLVYLNSVALPSLIGLAALVPLSRRGPAAPRA